MKVSLIIAVYKDYEALGVILNQLRVQTYQDFEVIVAEDACSQEIHRILDTYDDLNLTHLYQEDKGIRKMRSQNRAVNAATGEYLIFIDGDCIPYHNFIEAHVLSASEGTVLSGRRVNLGPKYSQGIRDGKISSEDVSRNYLKHFFPIFLDGKEGHAESGFSFPVGGIVDRFIISKLSRSTSILGCNFSCYKDDIISINGFDESYGETAIGDDTDIEWRFLTYGMKLKSVKNFANVFHLYHEKRNRVFKDYDEKLELMRDRKQKGLFRAASGLDEMS